MFERFDVQARQVMITAGNIAARRERKRSGEHFPRHVRVQVRDVREALELLIDGAGWQGGFNAALTKRFETLRAKTSDSREPITVDDLREILR